MRLSPDEARRRFAASRVARLASVRPDGGPHVIPVVFALVGETVVTSVDDKPKATTRLQRLVNLREEPRCSLLADAYHDDWSRLWWVRADGRATVVDDPHPDDAGRAALIERYEPYATHPPPGALVRIEVERWTGWASDPHAG